MSQDSLEQSNDMDALPNVPSIPLVSPTSASAPPVPSPITAFGPPAWSVAPVAPDAANPPPSARRGLTRPLTAEDIPTRQQARSVLIERSVRSMTELPSHRVRGRSHGDHTLLSQDPVVAFRQSSAASITRVIADEVKPAEIHSIYDPEQSILEEEAAEAFCPPLPTWAKRLIIGLLFGGICLALYFGVIPHLTEFLDVLDSIGGWAHLVIIVCLMLSGVPPLLFYLVFELGAGFIFKDNFGIALITVIAGGFLGACVGFAFGYRFRHRVLVMIAERPRLAICVDMIQANAFKFMFLFRLSYVPFSFLNAVCGVSNMKFGHYLLYSIPPMAIQQSLVVWMGSGLRDLAGVVKERPGKGSAGSLAVGIIQIVSSLLLLIIVGIFVKRAVAKQEAIVKKAAEEEEAANEAEEEESVHADGGEGEHDTATHGEHAVELHVVGTHEHDEVNTTLGVPSPTIAQRPSSTSQASDTLRSPSPGELPLPPIPVAAVTKSLSVHSLTEAV